MELDGGYAVHKLMLKCSTFGKDEKSKMGSRQRYFYRSYFVFSTQDTIEGVSVFRLDNRTMKRGNFHLQWLSSATKCELHLHIF